MINIHYYSEIKFSSRQIYPKSTAELNEKRLMILKGEDTELYSMQIKTGIHSLFHNQSTFKDYPEFSTFI